MGGDLEPEDDENCARAVLFAIFGLIFLSHLWYYVRLRKSKTETQESILNKRTSYNFSFKSVILFSKLNFVLNRAKK